MMIRKGIVRKVFMMLKMLLNSNMFIVIDSGCNLFVLLSRNGFSMKFDIC